MGLNTPRGPEKQDQKYDDKKKQQTPVKKIFSDSKDKAHRAQYGK